MGIVNKLAFAIGRNDEQPNIELAEELVSTNNKAGVKELVELLHTKNKQTQSDSIKVLYEIGERAPEMILPYSKEFLGLIKSKNNRLAWGAMTAINHITSIEPALVHNHMKSIIAAANKGSVISNDQAVKIVVKLASINTYQDEMNLLLLDMLANCAPNQLPMYAEESMSIISSSLKEAFINLYTSRLVDLEKESKRKRLQKVILKLQKM